jgi:hypothetical protein
MIKNNAQYFLQRLRKKILLIRCGELLLWSTGATAMWFVTLTLLRLPFSGITSVLVFIGVAVAFAMKYQLLKLNDQRMISFINSTLPEMEESAELLTQDPSTLTPLEQIQLQRTLKRFEALHHQVKFNHQLGKAAIFFALSLVTVIVLPPFTNKVSIGGNPSENREKNIVTKPEVEILPVGIEESIIEITPPPYTGLKPFRPSALDLTIPEGSKVTWTYKFTGKIKSAAILLETNDSLRLFQTNNQYVASKIFTTSGIYQLSWRDEADQLKTSNYYKIEVIQDEAPNISIKDLHQSTELTIKDKQILNVIATISDDYRLTGAHIIATVSKGSGESVKFREEKLHFTSPTTITGNHVSASRTLDLKKLGLEPGDEIYFYAEAFDNRNPIPNKSRTETYFITLRDAASENMVFDASLGVDLMPEYFRSQRQIIIDTEKLLRNKKSLTKKEFSSISNELGYDQKVLRLKYGEFLGEEFESELAPSDNVDAEVSDLVGQEDEENLAEKFGHAHDKDNEHNLVEEKKLGIKSDNHDHENKDPEAKENPLEAFVHAHDDAEEATYFLQSVRTKLKAALTEMWDAELYLRLYQPEKSLPFQYKALRLLKEVSNDSRIYVHKTGFDPPPLKEEKRLSGDLTEIKNSRHQRQTVAENLFASVEQATTLLENKIQQHSSELTPIEKKILSKAGQEISALAVEKPLEFLPALSAIKELNEGESKSEETQQLMKLLLARFWKALPSNQKTGIRSTESHHALDRSFIEKLQGSTND